MLTAAGVIAKVIEFVLTKLAGKQIDLALDEKKRAAQSFLMLFEALLKLERVTNKLLRHIQPVVVGEMQKLWMPEGWSLELGAEIDSASAAFLRVVKRLAYSISLLDPALGIMLGYVSSFKADVLCILSLPIEDLTFSIVFNQSRFTAFKYTLPSNDIDEKSLESLYATARKFEGSHFEKQVEWPKGSGSSLFGELVDKATGSTAEDVRKLSELLTQHITHLQTAREHLRVFIAKNFKIEDLIVVSDRMHDRL